jgi:hypothetical protein
MASTRMLFETRPRDRSDGMLGRGFEAVYVRVRHAGPDQF